MAARVRCAPIMAMRITNSGRGRDFVVAAWHRGGQPQNLAYFDPAKGGLQVLGYHPASLPGAQTGEKICNHVLPGWSYWK